MKSLAIFLRDYAIALIALLGVPLYAVTLASSVYERFLFLGEGGALVLASAPVWLPLLVAAVWAWRRLHHLAKKGLERHDAR